jgi:hypothetical protein
MRKREFGVKVALLKANCRPASLVDVTLPHGREHFKYVLRRERGSNLALIVIAR